MRVLYLLLVSQRLWLHPASSRGSMQFSLRIQILQLSRPKWVRLTMTRLRVHVLIIVLQSTQICGLWLVPRPCPFATENQQVFLSNFWISNCDRKFLLR